jgi:hypothetical protein
MMKYAPVRDVMEEAFLAVLGNGKAELSPQSVYVALKNGVKALNELKYPIWTANCGSLGYALGPVWLRRIGLVLNQKPRGASGVPVVLGETERPGFVAGLSPKLVRRLGRILELDGPGRSCQQRPSGPYWSGVLFSVRPWAVSGALRDRL